MIKLYKLYCFCLILLTFFQIRGQEQLYQFSGLVLTADSLKPVPFTAIQIKGTRKGTVSDFKGFFSIVASKHDTLVFSSVGFKKAYYIVPDTLTKEYYTMFQVMQTDTIYLQETVIYPWPLPSQFKYAFLNLNIPDDDLERAKKNIELMNLKDNIFALVPMDGSTNYKNYIQKYVSNLYTAGQYPQNNLLNPFAWIAFFNAWQRGEFKKLNPNVKNKYPPDFE